MRVEITADGGIVWIDPTHVIAVALVGHYPIPGSADSTDIPWRVYVTLDTGQRDCVYRNHSRAHARAVAGEIVMRCDGVLGNGGFPDDVHSVTKPVDSRLCDEPYRHSNEVPARFEYNEDPV